MATPTTKLTAHFGYGLFAIVMAWVILFISFSRLSLSVLAKQGGEFGVKQQLISFNEDSYSLPNVTTLPSSPFYGLKVIRDYFWILFSSTDLEKSRVSLFIADKYMAEMYALINSQEPAYALDAAFRAKAKLEESSNYLDHITIGTVEKGKIQGDLTRAGSAYRLMAESLKPLFDLDQAKYSELIKEFDEWNQKQADKIKEKLY